VWIRGGFSLLAVAFVAAALVVPALVGAQSVESQLNGARAKERSLSASVQRLDQLLDEIASDIALLQRRQGEVQADLDFERTRLMQLRNELREQRARAARLKARLAHSRVVLERRMIELYKSGRPDMLTVLVQANGFADLLERGAFLKRIHRQDKRVIELVRTAKRDARNAIGRLGRLTRRQQLITVAVTKRRDALAELTRTLQAKRASMARARAARASALRRARGNRQRLEKELSRLQSARAASFATAGGGGSWAIPWSIVQCESGGYNHPPNHAGASGYYQFIPATWRGLGGSTPHAYQASKAEQDRLAARLWDGGRGARNWDCAALVGVI
jgi:peptidoglycan hydrolase CwlO-like protein